MKRGGRLFIACLILLISLLAPASVLADAATVNMQSFVLESFDPGPNRHTWYAQGSANITKDYPKWTFAKAWPEALFGRNSSNADLQVLGVNAKWDRQGYNYIEIFPVTKDANGNIVPDPIQIPGRVQSLDLWVWGSNHDYTMDVELQDYTGVVHTFHLGSLNYPGWQDLTVNVPSSVPQSVNTIPKLRGLKLVKFVIWTNPTADVSNFYVYLDQIKVLTNTFENRIDGEDLANPAETQQIWSGQGVSQGQ